MNIPKIKLLYLCVLCLVFTACTRDDLCPSGTAGTPNLVVRFKDANLPNNFKQVGLNVFVDDVARSPIIRWSITDSVAIPLDVNSNVTNYIFQKYLFVGNDTLYWEDQVRVGFDRKDIYVNRACGFRAEFHNFRASLDSNSWIDHILINKDSITDEKAAHLTIFH